MRMLILLVLMWLGSQHAALWLEWAHDHRGSPTARSVERALDRWPEETRAVAEGLIARHGLPDRVEAGRMIWERGAVEWIVFRDPPEDGAAGPIRLAETASSTAATP